jgi:16S rRNA (cytosine967-C5)-methyltransferase
MTSMKKKVHRPALYGLIQVLDQSFNQGFYADKVLERHFFQNKNMGAKDRKFFAETFYNTIRWWRRLRFSMGLADPPPSNGEINLYSEQDFKAAVTAWCVLNDYDLGPFEREGFGGDSEKIIRLWELANPDSVRESYPNWFWAKGEDELGDKWKAIAQGSNQPAPLFLRVNRLRSDPAAVKQRLGEELIQSQTVSTGPDALRLPERRNVFKTKAFKEGLFEVQDLGSQLIAPFVQAEPGMRVIDACAGAGGKSLHLAALMNNRGKILCMDVHDRKLKELRERSRRAGVDSIETRLIESSKTVKRLVGHADRLLLDVPCSGSGVIRRNPDSKWKMTDEECNRLIHVQREILTNYVSMVKSGGKMVYATCSIFPSENELQVKWFLEKHPGWKLEEEFHCLPSPGGSDGFYGARLAKI